MISPLSYIHPDAVIGKDVKIDPFAFVGNKVIIGDGTYIMSGATVLEYSTIGKNCRIFPNAIVGGIPQDLKYRGEETRVEIGDGTTIRECVTVNRGTTEKWKTTLGKNCLIMAYCHIAHDCVLGNNVILANDVQLAGHVEIGDYAIIGGMSVAIQFSKIGAHAYLSGKSEIVKDVPPFIKGGRTPLSYAGINAIGLQRRGFSNEIINNIQEIYRVIYLKGLNISQAIEAVNTSFNESDEKLMILDFIKNSKRGIVKAASKDLIEKDVSEFPINTPE